MFIHISTEKICLSPLVPSLSAITVPVLSRIAQAKTTPNGQKKGPQKCRPMIVDSVWRPIDCGYYGVPLMPEKAEHEESRIGNVTLSTRRLCHDYVGELVVTTYRLILFIPGSCKALACKISAISPEYEICDYPGRSDLAVCYCESSERVHRESFSFQGPQNHIRLIGRTFERDMISLGETFMPGVKPIRVRPPEPSAEPQERSPIGFGEIANANKTEADRKAQKLKEVDLHRLRTEVDQLMQLAKDLQHAVDPKAQAVWHDIAAGMGMVEESAEKRPSPEKMAKAVSQSMMSFWRKPESPRVLSAAEAYACFVRGHHSKIVLPKDFKRALDYIEQRGDEFRMTVSKIDGVMLVMFKENDFVHFWSWAGAKLEQGPLTLLDVAAQFNIPRGIAKVYLAEGCKLGLLAIDEAISGTRYFLNRFPAYLKALN
jgi:hypothetical protein